VAAAIAAAARGACQQCELGDTRCLVGVLLPAPPPPPPLQHEHCRRAGSEQRSAADDRACHDGRHMCRSLLCLLLLLLSGKNRINL
jgi:hypothetical protein